MTRPWFEADPAALERLERTLRARYPTLHAFIEDGACMVRGTYPVIEGGRAIDRYEVKIALPPDYPASLPLVWETGGRIPREAHRHVFEDVGCLCLGVPLALWIQLKGDFSLPTILDIPLRNFLIGNGLVEQGEPWPHGDHSHGVPGILEFYGELLGTSEPMAIAEFLLAVVKGTVRGHWLCPCGSGQIIRKCHRDAIESLRDVPREIVARTGCMILDEIKRARKAAEDGLRVSARGSTAGQ
jgi:hypothetical protein